MSPPKTHTSQLCAGDWNPALQAPGPLAAGLTPRVTVPSVTGQAPLLTGMGILAAELLPTPPHMVPPALGCGHRTYTGVDAPGPVQEAFLPVLGAHCPQPHPACGLLHGRTCLLVPARVSPNYYEVGTAG